MAGILADKYQDYRAGKIGYDEATGAGASKPAIIAAANPQTNQSGQTQLPSWMGNQYGQVQGTSWYSTNPSNQNASKYDASGSPIASMSYDNQKTGTKFDGYGTQDQFNQVINAAKGGVDNSNIYESMIKGNQLISNDSIYNNINKAVATGTDKGPAIKLASEKYNPNWQTGTMIPTGQTALNTGYDPNDPVVASILNAVKQKSLAINQDLDLSQQANNAQVSENNRYRDESSAKLAKQKNIDLENATQFQNRRGGFYSGGLDYQQGSINNGYQEAVGGLERDTSARNNAIWSNSAALAKQAADKLMMLQTQTPDEIRAAISAAAEKQQAKDIQMAGLTGNYRDTAQFNAVQKKMSENSAAYANASPAEQQRLHAENMQLAASVGGKDTTGNGDYSFGQGIRTLEGRKADYNEYKDSRDYEYQQAIDQIKLGQWDKEFDLKMKDWADKSKLDWATLDMNTKKALAQIAIDQQQVAISRMNANTSAASAANSNSVARDRLNWDMSPNNPSNAAKATKMDSKESANNYSVIMSDLSTEGVTKDQATALVQANSAVLSDSDYGKLIDFITKTFK